ncbi:MAG: hypothetical protein IPL32_09525 [Chloracidobacterium sp.]|nr:hypothetical protein [Chloracidobacterium sp.]
MELEFDKEIDAILRKARPDRGVLEPESKEHLDADVIAAFAENALPEKARLLYVGHFADCDRCRKQLSFAMQMSVTSEDSFAPAVSKPAVETILPWYQRLFRTPNLALGMGALVLVFGGLLGFLVLQRSGKSNETISQIAEPDDKRGGAISSSKNSDAMPTPSEVPMSVANAATMSANSASNTAMARRDAEQPTSVTSAPADAAAGARSGQFQVDGASGSENTFIIDGQEAAKTQAAKKPAAAAPVTDDSASTGVAAERDEKKATAEALKEEDKDRTALAKRKADARSVSRDAPPPPPKLAGPMRSQQNQSNQSNIGQMSVTRTVSGKTFSNRNGAWYDSAYNNQPTTNIRRGTNEYKKLDGGLRNIVDSLGGIVVVVWKAKAYRIQ